MSNEMNQQTQPPKSKRGRPKQNQEVKLQYSLEEQEGKTIKADGNLLGQVYKNGKEKFNNNVPVSVEALGEDCSGDLMRLKCDEKGRLKTDSEQFLEAIFWLTEIMERMYRTKASQVTTPDSAEQVAELDRIFKHKTAEIPELLKGILGYDDDEEAKILK